MNIYLNGCVQKSMQPPRVPSVYKHRYEKDSFSTLNAVGLATLPDVIKPLLSSNHTTRLRTTIDVDPKRKSTADLPILARICKVRLADLDIYSPHTVFDLRLSINIEVDLNNRDDIEPSLIVVPSEQEKDPQPARHKNRLSYKHCAYAIDLTQVTFEGSDKKTHEMEVEVDAVKLRQHASLLKEGRPNAYEQLVKGLVDNCVLLMRVKGE